MYGFLRRPSWIGLGLVSLLLGVAFASLGLWQMRRLGEVQRQNSLIAERLAGPVNSIETVVDGRADPVMAADEYAFIRVTATGTFDPTEEVLIRSQTNNGIAGFHVVTPLILADGMAVLVNRGWVPLDMETPPVPASPPAGPQTVAIVLQPTQLRGRFGPTEPEGELPRLSRIDIERIAEQVPYDLYPVYGLAAASGEALPVAVELPELTDGPHLSYAIQWFAFVGIAVGGFALLVRREASRSAGTRPPAGDVVEEAGEARP